MELGQLTHPARYYAVWFVPGVEAYGVWAALEPDAWQRICQWLPPGGYRPGIRLRRGDDFHHAAALFRREPRERRPLQYWLVA